MQCSQIQPYLRGYASGSLPGYKVAWVAQHLAGCAECQALLAAERREASRPAQPGNAPQACTQEAPVPALIRRGETSVAIQRPVPAWFRLTALLVLTVAAAGCVWVWATARDRAPARPEAARSLPDATVGR